MYAACIRDRNRAGILLQLRKPAYHAYKTYAVPFPTLHYIVIETNLALFDLLLYIFDT